MRWATPVLWVVLTGIALGLRCWALTWGLPHSGRYYPYHPDEAILLDAVCRVNPLGYGDFAPSFYHYGSLTILITRIAYDLLAPFTGWGPVPSDPARFPQWVDDFARLYLVGRWVTVLLGAATVPVVFLLGRRLFNPRTGWMATIFLCVAPGPVWLGHYFTVDIPAALFTTLALPFAASAQSQKSQKSLRPALLWLAAGGLVAGLAAGTKYTGALALVPLALVALYRPGVRERLGALSAIAAAAVAGFLLATPGVLVEPRQFLHDLLFELRQNAEGQGLIFRGTPPAALYHLAVSLPVALEWPLYLLSLVGVGYALRKREPGDWLILAFLVPAFLILAPSERKFVRYMAPLVPLLVLLAARVLDVGLSGRARPAWAAAGVLAAGAALASSVAHLGMISRPDARDQAADYLRRVSSPDDVVALGGDPWYYTPPVHPTAGCVKVSTFYGGPPAWDRTETRSDLYPLGPYRLLAPHSQPPEGPLPEGRLRKYRPRRVVLTDFEYEDPERLRRDDPGFQHPLPKLEDALREEGYRIEREFRPRPSFAGFTWWSRGTPPHDWRYPMPAIRVYVRE